MTETNTYAGPVLMNGRRYDTLQDAADAHVARLSWLCEDLTRSEVLQNRDTYGRPVWTPAT